MRMRVRSRLGGLRVAAVASLAVCAWSVSAAAQTPADVETLMTRVAARVADYYRRAQSLICLERSIVQPIRTDWVSAGVSRTVESELRIESEAIDGDGGVLPKARVTRSVRRVNGRAPRERDKTDRSGCTDPSPLSPEPLAFLLPSQRSAYRFTGLRQGKEQDRAALIVDFVSADRTSKPQLIEDERGHDDCFDWTGPLASRGKIWIDAETHEVLRVDRHIDGPVDVRVPVKLQRTHNLPPWIVIERDDQTLRYAWVKFSDPEESVLLPRSIDSVTVIRTALQSQRRSETFSEYRRFLTTGRVVK
jgi:hypothetical protein